MLKSRTSSKKSVIASACVVCILLACLFVAEYFNHDESEVNAVKGILNLKNIGILSSEQVSLNGEWEFYWNQLLEPEDFKSMGTSTTLLTGYAKIPSVWAGKIGDTQLSTKGCATYRMVVKGIPFSGLVGLKKPNIRMSCRMYINGVTVLEDGKPANSKEEYRLHNVPQMVFFDLQSSEMEVIIHVANYDYLQGGIPTPIYFGNQQSTILMNIRSVIFEASVAGILFVIGLIYISLFIFGGQRSKREVVFLAFGMNCIFFSFTNMSLSERIILLLFPNLPFSVMYEALHFCILSSLICVSIFLNQLNDAILPRKIRNFTISVWSCLIIILLAVPMDAYIKILGAVALFDLFFTVGVMLLNLTYYIDGNHQGIGSFNHLILLLAIFCINVYNIDLILFSWGYTTNFVIGNIGHLVFAFSSIFLLALRYSKVTNDNILMTKMILEKEKEILANENAFLRSQIKPHFLYNALSTIISFCYTDPQKAGNLLTDLSRFLRQSFDFDINVRFITLREELNLIASYVEIEKARFGDKLTVSYKVDEKLLEQFIPPLILQPIVENSIRHGVMKRSKGGRISVEISENEGFMEFLVEDDGVGDESLNHYLYLKERKRGVGLFNIQKRLLSNYGTEIVMLSVHGGGSRVSFKIPIKYVAGNHLADISIKNGGE